MTITRPLLAAKTTDADLQKWKRWPMMLSPKIDGVRALVVNDLRSRSMKLIPNLYTQSMFARPDLYGLDGELVVGRPFDKNLMQQTTSGVMSVKGTPEVSYWVFDRWDLPSDTFQDRYELVSRIYAGVPGIQIVPHYTVWGYEEMLQFEELYLSQGYEGVMLRDPEGGYKQNRSTLKEGILLKVKRFHDGEAEVLDYEALQRNQNAATQDERGYTKRSSHQANKVADDLLGTVLVRDLSTGVIFNVGSGFTEAQRQHLWDHRHELKGKIIKYKSLQVGVKDKPRHPIFLGFRSLLDL